MKSLKKCFSLAGGRKSGLSFAKLLCGLVMLAVPLYTSCGQKKIDVQKVLEKESYNASELMVAVPWKNFSILATEVTQELYESVMGWNPSKFEGEKNLPVEEVCWYDAVEFCNELSKKAGLELAYSINGVYVEWNENANGYRLPTVEEWQYAAKGGQKFRYSGSDCLGEVNWYEENSEEKTHPVAQKKPNGYGLYDMSGNVWEWCWDFYPGDGSGNRYFCGGGWRSYGHNCEVDAENWRRANSTYDSVGFRVVRSTGK